jgi:hypothetical protein
MNNKDWVLGPRMVRPSNLRGASDPRFWSLREIQAVLAISDSVPDSRVEERSLVDETNGFAIRVSAIAAIPRKSEIAVLAHDESAIHLFSGVSLQHRAKIEFDGAPAVAMSVAPDYIVLRQANNVFTQLSLESLYKKFLTGSATVGSSLPTVVKTSQLHARATRVDFDSEFGFALVGLVGESLRLLLWTNSPFALWLCEWTGEQLRPRQMPLRNDDRTLSSIDVSAVCIAGINQRAYLADARGGRIYEVGVRDAEPRLVTVAGDGVAGVGVEPIYGPPLKSRLGRIVSLCEFRFTPVDAATVSGLAVPSPEIGDWLKDSAGSRIAAKTDGFTRLIEETPFLLAVSHSPDVSFSVSLPRNGKGRLGQLPEETRLVLPLHSTRAGSRASNGISLAGRLCATLAGPGVVYYEPGSTSMCIVQSRFKEFADELTLSTREQAKLQKQIDSNKNWVAS